MELSQEEFNQKPRMVFVVRKDLGMGRGKIAAQVAHAAVRLALQAQAQQPNKLAEYIDWGEPKICLYIPDETQQNELIKALQEANLPHTVVRDAGKTQIDPNTQTVVGIGPAAKGEIDKLTNALKLIN